MKKKKVYKPLTQRWEFIKENKKARKQENKNSPKKKRKTFFSWSSSCFVVFFYKFPTVGIYSYYDVYLGH